MLPSTDLKVESRGNGDGSRPVRIWNDEANVHRNIYALIGKSPTKRSDYTDSPNMKDWPDSKLKPRIIPVSDQKGALGQRDALFQPSDQKDFLKCKMTLCLSQENALLNCNPK
jgi:hypothetical protein